MPPSRRIQIGDTVFGPDDSPPAFREKLARITLEAMEQYVALLDPAGVIVEINPKTLAAFGMSAEDVIGRELASLFWWQVSAETNQGLRQAITQAAGGERVSWESEVCADLSGATTLIVAHTLNPIFDTTGEVVYLSAEGRDVTARVMQERANQGLRAEAGHLSEVFRRAPSFMNVLRGPKHVFELANDAYLELVGKRDLIGRSVEEAFPELAGQPWLSVLDQVYRTGEPFLARRSPVQFQRVSGAPLETRYLDFILQPLRGPDGAVTGIYVDGHDVTEQKATEDALRLANQRKDEFLATLSHELRTPLNPVLLLASEAAENRELPEAVRQDFQAIVEHIRIESRLIDDLLDISRITHGKLVIERRVCRMEPLLSQAWALVGAEEAARELQVTMDLRAPGAVVRGDAVRLLQIFANVLRNAVKFTPAGGRIQVTMVARDATTLEVAVVDSGIGMTPEELDNAFRPFTQGEHGSRPSKPLDGLGLGLTIAQSLAHLHGGTIRAESAGRGQGATFRIELPLAGEEGGTVEAAPGARNDGHLRDLRVLLVEDHAGSRVALARLLRSRGMDVTAVETAEAAMAAAAQDQFALVISDIGLPGMDGYALMAVLRDTYGYKGIALSGYGTERDIARSLEAGFIAHLTKPVQKQALDKVLARV